MELVQKKVAALHVPSAIRVEYGGSVCSSSNSLSTICCLCSQPPSCSCLSFCCLNSAVSLRPLRSFHQRCSPLPACSSHSSLTGTTFNLSSFMGLIMVVGIVAKNGILLLDADQKYRSEGMSPRDAMLEAGSGRFRPILMTALAAVAGMIPLSLALGAGSQMLQPLAIAVIGGIIASMRSRCW